MGIYFYTQDGVITTWYIPAMTANAYQGFAASASDLLSGYQAYYCFDQQNNTALHSNSWSGWISSTIATPDEFSVNKLYITSRNNASNPRYPSAFYLQGRAVGWQFETIVPETSLNFTAPNQTLEFNVSSTSRYSYLRLYLNRRSSYVAINERQVDTTVYWPKPPAPTWGTDFNFLDMTVSQMEQLLPYTWGNVSFVAWQWVWSTSSGSRTAWLLIDGIGSDYSAIEMYYSGYRIGSSWYLCWVSDTFLNSTTSDRKNLAIYWWTYDGSNTAWGTGGSYFSNVSNYRDPQHKHSLLYNFNTWQRTAYYDDVDYATWTDSRASTVRSRLNWTIYFQLCWVNTSWIETAWYRLIR